MMNTNDLLSLIDQFAAASGGIKDTTLSYRMFGDSKKIRDLREGAGITLSRLNAALGWLSMHWPEGTGKPTALAGFARGDAA